MKLDSEDERTQTKEMNKHAHPTSFARFLGLAPKLNFNRWKVNYSNNVSVVDRLSRVTSCGIGPLLLYNIRKVQSFKTID